jgi:hypothetical protein
MRSHGMSNALLRSLTKGGCEGQEVKQSEANAGENLRSLDSMNKGSLTLEKPPAKYSGKNPDDQLPFSKRPRKQVVEWEDRSELLP